VKSDLYEESVCRRCGVKLVSDRWSLYGIPYRTHIRLSETAVSRALDANHHHSCRHEWYQLSFGANSGTLWGWREAADGGTQFFGVKTLLLSDAFARGLAKTPDPPATWEALLAAGEAAPKEMNLLVEEWFGAEDPFEHWWMRNEKRVKQLGRGQAP
jgi:hypothetical protein